MNYGTLIPVPAVHVDVVGHVSSMLRMQSSRKECRPAWRETRWMTVDSIPALARPRTR
jgi:hypothetical protein